MQWWFKILQRRQEPWRWGAQWPAIRSWKRPIERTFEADPLTTTPEIVGELTIDHSIVIRHLKQIRKVKMLDKWVPHELTPNQKKFIIPKCHLFLYATAVNHFSVGFWCMTKSGFYMTTGDSQLSGWTEKSSKALPKAKLAPKKGPGHCLMVCYWSDLQLSESQWNQHSIWKVCSANQWDSHKTVIPAVSIGHQKGDQNIILWIMCARTSHNQHFKSWTNWATKFCLIRHVHLASCQPTPTSSSISTTFCRENTSRNNRRQEMLSKSLLNPEAWIFTLQE